MLERSRSPREERARQQLQPEEVLRRRFASVLGPGAIDARFVDSRELVVAGAAGMPCRAPVMAALLADGAVYRVLEAFWRVGRSALLRQGLGGEVRLYSAGEQGRARQEELPSAVAATVTKVFDAVPDWAGAVNAEGQYVVDPRTPSPGPHFGTNLLLGNRIGFFRPLQTTPKSVVDRLGRGSFRSHSATQVLATRWDLRAEDNGFPANRQCYLLEDGEQIFYSGWQADPNVTVAETVHAPNRTIITHYTRHGLEITRTIFLLPQEEDLPLATEVHAIIVHNHGNVERRLRLVVTGMFGPAAPNALWEDVLYTIVSSQARVLRNAEGEIIAISPHYQPKWTKGDERFHTAIGHQHGRTFFPTEFGTNYEEFVGQGTLEQPDGLRLLSNRLSRKGPGFFAVAVEFTLAPGEGMRLDNFTGLVSDKAGTPYGEDTLLAQVAALVERFRPEDAVAGALAANGDFFDLYRQHLTVVSGDQDFDAFVNYNLPFQILYQTFVSRSFDQTQKGHREIGFREVQDLFASMAFFVAMGRQGFVKELLKEWAGQIYEFGYANHNFYWEGKEPGEFSDDALWFVQAVDRYVTLTDDLTILDERCAIAGQPGKERTIYQALQAVLFYSGEVSTGKHGLPLLDRADWNDTLRLDPHYLNGPEKEHAYREQLARGGRQGGSLQTDNSESVMNGFLLKIAVDAVQRFAERRNDRSYVEKLAAISKDLYNSLQQSAWKKDFFARVLINRPGGQRYLGAKGDGLSADPKLGGTYFLNSFTWSILAGVATEDQIRTMLAVIKRVLHTPYGLKLCSPVNFAAITARGGSAEYFPGDRENGGVFKHADMMAAVALLQAARVVHDRALALELWAMAYEVIDVVLPYGTMADPFVLAGNPRFCTQYNNSETGENVGPTVSGTAPWLWLALGSAFGLSITSGAIVVDPLLRGEQQALELRLRTGKANYHISVFKPEGFYRSRDQSPRLTVDGKRVSGNAVPQFDDGAWHEVEVVFPEAA